MTSVKRTIAVAIALAVVIGGCSGTATVTIDDAWARTSASTQNAGAAYMTIVGGDTADRLVAVSVASAVARTAELHETTMGSGDTDGMMMMQEVPVLEIPAGERVSLEPGGYHVMLMMLAEPLVTGAAFDVTLTFEQAGEIVVPVEVREG
ncbi:MAG: copper chaperone PCu(A)C [Acidimicrobiia bacterium]|nr:copper chaperone PCu(A)C [Acidimicrobiia bacterium]